MGLHSKHVPMDQEVSVLVSWWVGRLVGWVRYLEFGGHAMGGLGCARFHKAIEALPTALPGQQPPTKSHPPAQVHFLLTLSMAATTVTTAAEALLPQSFPLAAARPILLVLVGSWFVQIGRILFLGGLGLRDAPPQSRLLH
jgi:hypothetical protein